MEQESAVMNGSGDAKQPVALPHFCRMCGVLEQKSWEDHLESKRHLRNESVRRLKASVEDGTVVPGLKFKLWTEEDQVTVTEDSQNNSSTILVKVDSGVFGKNSAFRMKAAVSSEEARFQLEDALFLGKNAGQLVTVRKLENEEDSEVGLLELTCNFPKGQCGFYRIPLQLDLSSVRDGEEKRERVFRVLEFAVSSPVEAKLVPKILYTPRKWQFSKAIVTSFQELRNIIRGNPAQLLPSDYRNQLEPVIPLPPFPVPLSLRLLAARNFKVPTESRPPIVKEEQRVKKLLSEELSSENYAEKFQLLMHLEELQAEVGIREYDMENTNLRRVGNSRLFELKVPGLAENRPSVLRGDRLYVWAESNPHRCQFEGFVAEVREDCLWISFPVQFSRSFHPRTEYGVRFTFSRVPLKLMHRAVQMSRELSLTPLLFPVKTNRNLERDTLKGLELYDKKLEENPEQLEAVQHVLAGVYRPAPYIIFGPPGTGKTVTVVEAIKQILKLESRCRVLACAPSNAAADLLCQRLMRHMDKRRLLRLNALSRSEASCSEEVMECSTWSEMNGGFCFPSKDYIARYRVVITTLSTAGRLVTAKFAPGFFTHVFVDEAGQATEPETLTAISGLTDLHQEGQSRKNRTGHVILAGDPEQLGPVLQSIKALENGLGRSFLERLMKGVELYQKQSNGVYDRRFMTKLVRNYRSHPEILHIPSNMFYDGELVPCAEEKRRTSLAHWKELPKKGIPMMFHGIVGKDVREENSPSFFNPAEVSLIKDYVDKLIDGGGVKDSDIGIIAPYRKQVEKIRGVLRENLKKYGNISVGSVEEFQGAERRVIIISSVRSNPDFLSVDAEFRLGFLSNPKRFNTAVTRAKALLIMVGNPWVLERDHCWRKMLGFCVERGMYRGIEFQMEKGSEEEDSLEEGEIPE